MSARDEDLLAVSSHFAFGENWRRYAESVGETHIAEAQRALERLLGAGAVQGRSFLDIGCGSGLHALAAVRLGAARVVATDIDPVSVATAQYLLSRHASGAAVEFIESSVFDLALPTGFDIVYSWGVLHHTGDMWRAVETAAGLVAPGGRFAVALYARTPCCGFWRVEKRLYARSPGFLQAAVRGLYKAAFLFALAIQGRNPRAYVAGYAANRGMSWHHDVHDWLGGYPYESATPEEVRAFLAPLGFRLLAQFGKAAPRGLFGTGCIEYLFEKTVESE